MSNVIFEGGGSLIALICFVVALWGLIAILNWYEERGIKAILRMCVDADREIEERLRNEAVPASSFIKPSSIGPANAPIE